MNVLNIIIKTEIKTNINGSNNIYNISIPKLYTNTIIQNNITNNTKYSTIKSSIYRGVNKNLPQDIDSVVDLQYDSSYTKKK